MTAPGSKTWTFGYNDINQRTSQLMPNGMYTEWLYDTRNRLDKIQHWTQQTGGTKTDLFDYTLDDTGNIERITHLDDSYWDYDYDDRHRLTSAVRNNDGATIKATYSYTYDDGDNLLTKVTPFEDDFNDGATTGWSAGGAWSASTYEIKKSTSGTWQNFERSNSDADLEVWFDYVNYDTSSNSHQFRVDLRSLSSGDRTELRVGPHGMWLYDKISGAYTTLGSNTSATTTQDTRYTVRIVADGSDVTIYRAENGGLEEEVLSGTTSITTTDTLRFAGAEGTQVGIDNIHALSNSLSTTYTFSCNDANELESMTGPNGTTYFGYDELGRMTSKTRGTFTATYTWDYDSRLVDVASDFPDEGDVEYDYGGDGKRRQRVAGADETWYNWGAGYTVMGEEDGSNNVERTYVAGTLAHIEGASPASGTYAYYWHDHLGSTRALYDGTKNETGRYDYAPYGGLLHASKSDATTRQYTGHDWDADSGLYFAPFRYYFESTSRWAKRDPLGFVDGTNLYAYALNNPALLSDPYGLLVLDPLPSGAASFFDEIGRGCSIGSALAAGALSAGVAAIPGLGGFISGGIGGGLSNWLRGGDPVMGAGIGAVANGVLGYVGDGLEATGNPVAAVAGGVLGTGGATIAVSGVDALDPNGTYTGDCLF